MGPKTMAIILLVSAVTIGASPTAEAHTCKNHDPRECDGRDCREGEEHNHRDYNDGAPDDWCQTRADKSSCMFLGVMWPAEYCGTIREGRLPL